MTDDEHFKINLLICLSPFQHQLLDHKFPLCDKNKILRTMQTFFHYANISSCIQEGLSELRKNITSFFIFWEWLNVLHTLYTGKRASLSAAPPWPVNQTTATNIMRAVHLEEARQAAGGGQVLPGDPPPVIHSAFWCIHCSTSEILGLLLECSLEALHWVLVPLVYCRYQVHSGGHWRSPAQTDESLQRHQHRREEARGWEYSLHQLW